MCQLWHWIFISIELRWYSLAGTALVYQAYECTLVTTAGRHPLRSADNRTCLVLRSCNQFGDCCFATTGPTLWNSLPEQLRQPDITFENSSDRWRRLCVVICTAAPCFWTLRVLTRNLLTYLVFAIFSELLTKKSTGGMLCGNAAECKHVPCGSSSVSSDPGAWRLRGSRLPTHPGQEPWDAGWWRAGAGQHVLWSVWPSWPRRPTSALWWLRSRVNWCYCYYTSWLSLWNSWKNLRIGKWSGKSWGKWKKSGEIFFCLWCITVCNGNKMDTNQQNVSSRVETTDYRVYIVAQWATIKIRI